MYTENSGRFSKKRRNDLRDRFLARRELQICVTHLDGSEKIFGLGRSTETYDSLINCRLCN